MIGREEMASSCVRGGLAWTLGKIPPLNGFLSTGTVNWFD